MGKVYHDLRRTSPEGARLLVRKVLEQNGGNVSKTARILGISRKTVRRAREGPLEDLPRRPKSSPKRLRADFEQLILTEAKRTGYGPRRLSKLLWRKYSLGISPNTIKVVLRRQGLERKRRKVRRGSRPLYDYEHLLPFEELQVDTKYVLDQDSLPREVYEHIKAWGLPIYQWSLMDVATRVRFMALSYELSSFFGAVFLTLVLLWLRVHGVRWRVKVRMDLGSEFCGPSPKKQRQWKEALGVLGAEIEPVRKGMGPLQAVIERAHRSDDEEFYLIHAERCQTAGEFVWRVQRWQDTWNFFRPHFGRGMGGRTPSEVLRERSGGLISSHILHFPVVLLEALLRKVNPKLLTFPFHLKTGTYVFTLYQILYGSKDRAESRHPNRLPGDHQFLVGANYKDSDWGIRAAYLPLIPVVSSRVDPHPQFFESLTDVPS